MRVLIPQDGVRSGGAPSGGPGGGWIQDGKGGQSSDGGGSIGGGVRDWGEEMITKVDPEAVGKTTAAVGDGSRRSTVFRGPFAHVVHETVRPCEDSGIGWGAYRARVEAAVDVCGGPSTITCALFPRQASAWFSDNHMRAFFCWARNLVEYRDRVWMAGGGKRRFAAFCDWAPGFEGYVPGFWAELASSHADLPRAHTGAVPHAGILDVLPADSAPDFESLASNGTAPLLHLVHGDCDTGNPGHCIADLHNAFLVQELLGVPSADTTIVLASGVARKAVSETWNVLGSGGLYISLADNLPVDPTDTQPAVAPLLAWSPNPMYGPHWQAHRGAPPDCRGRSSVLLSYAAHVLPSLDAHVVEHMPSIISNETGSFDLCRAMVDYGVCGPDDWGTCYADGAVVGAPSLSGDAYDYTSGACTHSGTKGLIVYSRRTYRRIARNHADLVRALVDTFPSYVVVVVEFSKIASHAQHMLRRSARVLIGMHGGAMWGGAEVMRRGQTMVEIMPMLGPGTTCHFATLVELRYFAVLCTACTPANNHIADVPIDQVIAHVSTATDPAQADVPGLVGPECDVL